MPDQFAFELDGQVIPIPGALCGACGEQSLTIEAAGERKRFKGKAYSGGPLTLKGFPHPVVVDLRGVTIPSQKLPTPNNHDLSNTVGVTDAVTVHATNGIDVAGELDTASPDGQLIAAASKGGVDWELSIGAPVHALEEIRAGETVSVNGRAFTGPLFVARETTLREISFVRKGADLGQTWVSIAARLAEDAPPAEPTERDELAAVADLLAGAMETDHDFGHAFDGIEDAALESLFK